MRRAEELRETIQLAMQQLQASQTPAGYWEDCFDTGTMPDAHTVVCLRLLDDDDDAWLNKLLSRILASQRPDGSWGVYPDAPGDLSTTVECYYALQLCRRWSDEPAKEALARIFIHQHGGLKRCRNLTKMVLAVGGEIPWSWLPSPRLYSLLFENWCPISIWDIVTFSRLHIAPVLLLSSLGFVEEGEGRPVLASLLTPSQRRWQQKQRTRIMRKTIDADDLPPRLIRCLEWMMQDREVDGTIAGYHSSTFLLIFVLRALGYDKQHPDIQSMLRSMRSNLYVNEESGFCHQQTCNGHVWNTALAAKALLACGEQAPQETIERATRYLWQKQQHTVGEWFLKNPVQPAGWAFSSNNTRHPDADDTVACLEVLYPSKSEHETEWWQGVEWLLGMQNRDGGWSAFEKNCNRRWLEWIPANDMKRTICDPSTPDITARVIEFILKYRVLPRDDDRLKRGLHWLLRRQEADGSWFSRWGTTYIYGTWCAVKAFATAEFSSHHQAIRRAKEWLLRVQRPDGSFAESCMSDVKGHYVPLQMGLPTPTAWGLDALLHVYRMEENEGEQKRLMAACERAADWLLHEAAGGLWREQMPTASAFPGALYIRYHVYPKVWPLIALAHYQTLRWNASSKGGEQSVRRKSASNVSWPHRQSNVLAQDASNFALL